MKRFLLTTLPARRLCTFLLAALFATLRTSAMAHNEEVNESTTNLGHLNGGAQIECTTPDGRVELLRANETSDGSTALLRDETLSCPLQEGITTFVIKLPATALLDRFTFVNENAAAVGELKISVSNYQLPATSPKWVEVDGSVAFSRKRLFNLSMLGVEARYVKLSFKVETGGRLAGLGVYGAKPLDRVAEGPGGGMQFGWMSKAEKNRRKERTTDFDYAELTAKGRVVYVSSGRTPSAPRMIDDNHQTGYIFAGTDARPTAIVELAANERIHRVTALYKTHTPGRFDVYLLEDMSKSATDLNYRQPVATAVDEDGDGLAEVDFDPEGTRYVAVRFTPTDSLATDRPFEIIEINAYGDIPLAMLEAFEAPDVYAPEYQTPPFPGEGGPDISTKLGVVAIPPVMPLVSP